MAYTLPRVRPLMSCWRKMSKVSQPVMRMLARYVRMDRCAGIARCPPKKTAPAGAVFKLRLLHRLLRGCTFDEILEFDRLSGLDDCDWRDRTTFHGEYGHLGVLAITLCIEFDVATCPIELDPGELREIFRRVDRIGVLHRRDEQVGRIVSKRRIDQRVGIEFLLECIQECLARRLNWNAGLRADHAFGCGTGQLLHLFRTRTVSKREHRLQAQFTTLLEQWTGTRIHAAVENRIRALAFELSQNGLPFARFLLPFSPRQSVDAPALHCLLDLIGETLAVGRGIIDHRDGFGLVLGYEVTGDRRPLLIFAAHGAERDLEALLSQFWIGCRAPDHGKY